MAETKQRTSPNVAIDWSELRLRRQLAGDNQTEFAAKCGVTSKYISLIESGARPRVSPRVYARICNALAIADFTELMVGVREQSTGARSAT